MKHSELVKMVATKMNCSQAMAAGAVESIVESILEGVHTDGEVRVQGLGTFGVSLRAARSGRNPANGAAIEVPARTAPTFKAAPKLKSAAETRPK